MNKKEREAWLLQKIEEWKAEKEAEKLVVSLFFKTAIGFYNNKNV